MRYFDKLYLLFSFIVITYGSYTDFVINGMGIKLWISYIAGLTGVFCVFLGARERLLMYLFGFISVTLWIVYVAIWSPLIWDVLINSIYLILNIYGLYHWKNPQKQNQLGVVTTRTLTLKEKWIYLGIGLIGICILTYIGRTIGRYTSSTQALIDATTTVFAILGQWFMSSKILESWYMWILVNLISIPLYISIGSYTLAMVWVSYMVNAIYGFIIWNKNMKDKGV